MRVALRFEAVTRRFGRRTALDGLDFRAPTGTIVGLVASGRLIPEILSAYPYLEEQDVREALTYAAWRVQETEVPLGKPSGSG